MDAPPVNFFISYTAKDARWAEWLAWVLEGHGKTATVQAWDFGPGTNWIDKMHRALQEAERIIAVLSTEYLSASRFGTAEWQAAWAQDPLGENQKLIPVRVDPTAGYPGLLAGTVALDISGLREAQAEERVVQMLRSIDVGRAKPTRRPSFPGPRP